MLWTIDRRVILLLACLTVTLGAITAYDGIWVVTNSELLNCIICSNDRLSLLELELGVINIILVKYSDGLLIIKSLNFRLRDLVAFCTTSPSHGGM